MLALAVGAVIGGGGFRSGPSPGVMIFSTIATSSLTFAPLCRVPVATAVEALCHSAVFNEELTVMELPLMGQALFHQDVSFLRCPHLYEEGSMSFSKLERLRKPGNTQNFDPRVQS
jgi:hypothetical protein